MTDEQLILHLTRKNAELEERVKDITTESEKYRNWWFKGSEEIKQLKIELLALQKELIKDDLESIQPKEA